MERDNRHFYVIVSDEMRIQNWNFDECCGAFGFDVLYTKDDTIPEKVAKQLNLSVEHVDIVHECGNLEFTGFDTAILNWSAIGDLARNPEYAMAQSET